MQEWRGSRQNLSHPITEQDDPRLDFLLDLAEEIERWEREASSKREFMTRETAFDLRLACRAFVAFVRHNLDDSLHFEPVNAQPEVGLDCNGETTVVMTVLGESNQLSWSAASFCDCCVVPAQVELFLAYSTKTR